MKKHIIIILSFLCLVLCACTSGSGDDLVSMSAKDCLTAGEEALARDSVQQGEKLLRTAISKAEATADWHTCYIACQRLAESLSWSNNEEALRLAKRAVEIYERHPDDERNHVILLDYAGTYASQLAYNTEGSFDEALSLTRRAYDIAVRDSMDDLVCQTLTSLANIAWAKEDYRQALDNALRAKALATPELLQGVLQVLGRCYMELDSLDKAEAIYRQMTPSDDIHAAYIVQSSLAKIAATRFGAEESVEVIDSAFEQAEELYFKAMEQKDGYYQAALRQELENEHLAYTSALHRRMLIGIVAVLLLLGVAGWLIMRYRMRMLNQQREHEAERHEAEQRLNEQKNRMLQQEAESQQERLRQADEVIAFLQNYILQRTEVVQKLNQSSEARITLTQREWGEVERTLNAIDGDRFARIRKAYPDMEEDDIHLCILTRLQLSNRAIGNIYCISVSAVQHRKLKLKKDVFGEKDPDMTLEQVIINS